jgi:hypothetical protein
VSYGGEARRVAHLRLREEITIAVALKHEFRVLARVAMIPSSRPSRSIDRQRFVSAVFSDRNSG